MKRVLVIAPKFFDYHKSTERAFQQLGMATRLVEVSYLYESPADRLEYYAGKAQYFAKRKRKLNDLMMEAYNEFEPDLVFMIQESEVFRETLLHMKNAKKVIWMMDTINRNRREYVLWDLVDKVFFFEKTDIEVLWESHRIEGGFLPLALDESVYYPLPKTEEIDILFVGALYDDRMAILSNICRKYPERNIQIYGIKNLPLLQRLQFRLFREYKKSFRNKNIAPVTVNELYSKSRICLNIHHPQNKHGVNQRFFEISGSQAFQLVNNNDYISTNFSGDEVMTYDSTEELMSHLVALLNNEINTKKMALKAHQKVLAAHTFKHRMQYVLDTLIFE